MNNIEIIKKEVLEDRDNDLKIKKRGDGGFILEIQHKIQKCEEHGKNAITFWLKSNDLDIDITGRTNKREPISDYNMDKILIMFNSRLKGITYEKILITLN